MHFDEVLDIGYDYGADGGQAWETQIIEFSNGRTRRNQRRSAPLGQWQLGNRMIDAQTLDYLRTFMHGMRGRLHSFLYRDWTDYEAVDEQLVIDGTATSQLIKAYSLSINGWVRDIVKPDPAKVTIEHDSGAGFIPLVLDSDYTLDASTGIVTWLLDPLPDDPDVMRWSGEFWVPVRFDSDVFSAQFMGFEERPSGNERAYQIGSVSVTEEPAS